MSLFKDQLSEWNSQNNPAPAGPKPVETRKACRVVSRPPQKKTRSEVDVSEQAQPAAEEEIHIDDASLFAAAVGDIQNQSAAILAKYDATLSPQTKSNVPYGSSTAAAQTEPAVAKIQSRVDPDKMAFLDAMGQMGHDSKSRKLKKK